MVITGVSGSGKSSLAFDTIYAEGQRRYLESLSTYARMIVSSTSEDTVVDEIRGLSPTIAIHQKTVSNNPRSTVGTITEIYDFYRLLFTTVGTQICPNHPHIVLKKSSVRDIINSLENLEIGTKIQILAPFPRSETLAFDELQRRVGERGFVRFRVDGRLLTVTDPFPAESHFRSLAPEIPVEIVVDRLIVKDGEERVSYLSRLRDGLENAYRIGEESLFVMIGESMPQRFCQLAACPECDYRTHDLDLSQFSFNSPHGACDVCHGLGMSPAFLPEVCVNPKLTLAEGALLPWAGFEYIFPLVEAVCRENDIALNVPFGALSKAHKKILLYGTEGTFEIIPKNSKYAEKAYRSRYEGLIPYLQRRYRDIEAAGDNFAKRIQQFVTEAPCDVCGGHRLKRSSLSVLVGGNNIGQIAGLSVDASLEFFRSLKLSVEKAHIAKDVLKNIVERLEFLAHVGLGYVTLDRKAGTLSGGESQRIRLATQIGTRLEGIIYVLDEPSIGLHPRDNKLLITAIRRLAEIGNTVLVVEHDEDIMLAADHIVDVGPGAGVHGGKILFSGLIEDLLADTASETGAFLAHRKNVSLPIRKREPSHFITLSGARENNLQNLEVEFPLGLLTVITGVSGSGKSSLIMDTLAPLALNAINGSSLPAGKHESIRGLDKIDKVILIDQSPIGRTPHSNIATYTGVFTAIREVFAGTIEAQKRGYGPGRFSFNTKGGRCEACEGAGVKKIEMHFLPDVYVPCEICHGSRYNQETLEVRFKGKTVSEVLDMSVEEALEFFKAFPRIHRILEVLNDVGLGYIRLGQSAPTLSGGESQRIKLAFDLAKRTTSQTLYILDEPTTGLHFGDVQKLLDILDRLVQKGNSVIVIEHNLDIIANADWIVDIGPEGGTGGGSLIYSGTRDGILGIKKSHTGQALNEYLDRRKTTKGVKKK